MALGIPVADLGVRLDKPYDFHHAGLWLAERGIWLRDCVWNGRYGESFRDGSVYIVGIRSLNVIEQDHSVLLDTRPPHTENRSGWKFYDPNMGREGKRHTEWIDPNWVMDFCELIQHDDRYVRMGEPPRTAAKLPGAHNE